MYIFEELQPNGEPPPRKSGPEIPSSKGYPAYRDPQADKPIGVMPSDFNGAVSKGAQTAYVHRMRKKYSNAPAPGL